MKHMILGETCLLDYQLRRGGVIEGPHYLFDNMLVNLDGVSSFIENDFSHIHDRQYLYYLYYPNHGIGYSKWINLKYTKDNDNIFSWPVFAFFHYDAMSSEEQSSIDRKVERTKNFFEDGEDNEITLHYYYRPSDKYNIPKMKEKIKDFKSLVEKKYNKRVTFILVTNEESENEKLIVEENDNIIHGHFATKNTWIGIDDNWNAHLENSLFDEFFNHIK